MKQEYINVIIKRPQQELECKTIKNDLATLQEIVGGYIEAVSIDNNIDVICNEEAKILGLKPNIVIPYDYISGTAIFVGVDIEEGEFTSLSRVQTKQAKIFLNENTIYKIGDDYIILKRS